MKILHITHHEGCEIDFNFVCSKLGHDVVVQHADWNYNMTKKLSKDLWEKHKDYYNSFDVIVTSDTAPLSRIFLQNNYNGKLIIWVCNRFDYADNATNQFRMIKDKTKLIKVYDFPDKEYYDLFKSAALNKNVKIYSYTKFEHEYALKHRGVHWNHENLIKPCSCIEFEAISGFPDGIIKADVFFITRYHNDNILLDLKQKCDDLDIPNYRGTYNGPADLKGIKGIIHIPYAWSNLALFENWSLGNVYFIPSEKFLLELSKTGDFFWSPPFDVSLIQSSEWYLPEHKELFIYFDNWEELKKMTEDKELISSTRIKVKEFSKKHLDLMLEKWKTAIEKW